ncbi:unnamed protein product, partial [Allacma fusca]
MSSKIPFCPTIVGKILPTHVGCRLKFYFLVTIDCQELYDGSYEVTGQDASEFKTEETWPCKGQRKTENPIGPTRKTTSTKQACLDSTKFKEVRILCERIDTGKWRANPRRFSNQQALDHSENIAPEIVFHAYAPSGGNLSNPKLSFE